MFFRFLSYNAVIVFSKLVSSFIVSKVSAVFLGPSGYALVGNFKNIYQIIIGITASGFESGTIKHIAENKNDKAYFSKIVSSIIAFSILLSFLIGFFLFAFASRLSDFTFNSIDYDYIFRYTALLLPLISINFLVIYIINGLQKISTYAKLITLTSIINAIVTFILIYFYSLDGALLATIFVSAITLISSLLIKDVREVFRVIFLKTKTISLAIISSMSTYILMATYSTILISLTYLSVRNNIISNFSEDVAGYWEAMNKISSFYMVFFTSIFTLYLLPKLSINKSVMGYKQIMTFYFKRIIPLSILIFGVLFLLRNLVIKLFLTNEFKIIEEYFLLQFIGDFIKIIAFSLAYQFHAKKMVTIYFISDAILYLSFYVLSIYFLQSIELKGVFYAYILSCVLYLFVVTLFIFTRNKNYLDTNA